MNDGMAAPAPLLREVPRTEVPTLLGAASRRPIVMVLGMHRSGTSLCSHVLSALGLDMTDNMGAPGRDGPNKENPLGHWERWEIVEFHDCILRFFNREFFSQAHDFALPVAWWADPRVANVRHEITAFLERRMGNGYFGFKDPRTVRLMPMWHQIVNELKLAPKIVFCLRNPAQVARSLNERDGFSLDTGEYRWFTYTVDFFRYTKSAEICTIEYESWFDDPASNLAKLRNFLDLDERAEFNLDLAISDLVRHEFRHDDPRLVEASQPLVRSLYKLARRADQDPTAREQAQTIAIQFVTFQQLQGALHRDFERQATTVARVSALEEEAAALRERAAAADAVLAEVERQRAQLGDLLRERDEAATALASARAEAEEERAARMDREGRVSELEEALRTLEAGAVSEIRAEVARLTEALARAEREVWDRAGLIETMRAELLSLNEALAQPRREAQERLGELASLESELAGLHEAMEETEREAIRRAEQEVQARAFEGAKFEREMAGLREALKRAQREAEQSTAAAKSLEGELAAAQAALATARRVGRAINALAMEKPALRERPLRLGWRQAARRMFGFATSA
jgi:hypothetical protein